MFKGGGVGESHHWGSSAELERAKTDELQRVFYKYASTRINGELFMTSEDFIRKFLGLYTSPDYNPESVKILAGMIDTSKDGLISFNEFQAFEGLLCIPDALYNSAFRLFDKNGNGLLSCDEFENIMKQTTLQGEIPFDLSGPFVRLYFGEKKERAITYSEFSQFIQDFHEEYAAEAFRRFDSEKQGFISVENFVKIMTTLRAHLLTPSVSGVLRDVVKRVISSEEEGRVSFPFFVAFNLVLENVELARKVYLVASQGNRHQEISLQEFQAACNLMSQITPLQSRILFALNSMINSSETLSFSDFEKLAPEQYYRKVHKRIIHIKAVESKEERNAMIEFLESAYRFGIGILAGAMAAIVAYPLDLANTRLQLDRPSTLYKGNLYTGMRDCLQKIVKHEGLTGLYRGLPPQVIGVAFGKAAKLTGNDYLRDKWMNSRNGHVPLPYGVLAGSLAGLLKAIFICPLEAVKIRLQVASRIHHERRPSSFAAAKGLLEGKGFYRGFLACCLRDVPFYGIFFPCYADLKVKLQDDHGYNSASSLFLAGILAYIPGSGVAMPFDKVKARLQSDPLPGQVGYEGLRDCFKKIHREEGLKGFWQGARLIKPSCEIGVTLLVYEILQRVFYVDFAGTRPTGSEKTVLVTGLKQVQSDNPDHVGGYSVALPIISGIETKFGLVFPKFRHKHQVLGNKKKGQEDKDKIKEEEGWFW